LNRVNSVTADSTKKRIKTVLNTIRW